MPLRLIAPGQRKGNRHYLIRGTVNGRRVEIATGTADKESAERLKAEAEQRLWKQSGAPAPEVDTFAGAANAYQAAKQPSDLDRGYIKKLIGHWGNRRLATITPADVLIAANTLYPGTKASTRNRQAVTPAGSILHFAARQKWCEWVRVEKFKEAKPETKAIRAHIAGKLIDTAPTPAVTALFAFLFYHGWRINEVVKLRWQDLDLTAARIRKQVSKQGGETVWKVLHSEVVAAFANLPGERVGRVFPWQTRWGAAKALRKHAKGLGVHFSPHMGRHTFATQAISSGADLKSLMKAGDWKHIQSVIRYADSEDERQKEILQGIGERLRGSKGQDDKKAG